ncbi:MAG: hypothetical protein NC078_07640 [Ruminococcus sp.]|nr:hypothetical protein [Ruminococcus sp.]
MKKNIIHIGFTMLFIAVCLSAAVSMVFLKGESDISGNPPEIFSEEGFNAAFSDDFEEYFFGSHPLRNACITAAAKIKSSVFSTGSEKVIVGRDGWLFYNEEVQRACGETVLSEREICSAARYLLLLEEYCESEGIDFLFAAAPDKAAVCSDKLPALCVPADVSDLDRLHEKLRQLDVPYCDIAPLFESRGGDYYLTADTHWNSRGAFTAYNAIADSLNVPHKSYEGADFTVPRQITGDLAGMLYPDNAPEETEYLINADMSGYRFIRPASVDGSGDREKILENLMGNSERYDMLIETENPSAQAGRAVVKRDSFCRAMLPFFMDNFKEAYFTRGTTVSAAELRGADCFVYETAQRNIGIISSAPCRIPAPQRDVPERLSNSAGGDLVEIKDGGELPCISGNVNMSVFDENPGSEICIVFLGEEDFAFEAFPLGENGFEGYVDISPLPAGEYEIHAAVGGIYSESYETVEITEY